MPFFKIRIAVKTEYISSIVVEAHDLKTALSYTAQDDEWMEDNALDDSEENFLRTKTPLDGHEIKNINEVPNRYGFASECIPWNGDRIKTFGEMADKEGVFQLQK